MLFFAAVEQLDHPAWKGKALAVGGGGTRGVVAAASYEARKYGVRSAMSGAMAKSLCPHLIFAKPRFDRYKEISNQIRSIFYEYTPLVEPPENIRFCLLRGNRARIFLISRINPISSIRSASSSIRTSRSVNLMAFC